MPSSTYGEDTRIPVALHLHGPWRLVSPTIPETPWELGLLQYTENLCVYNAWEHVGTQCACKHLVCMYSSHVCYQLVPLEPAMCDAGPGKNVHVLGHYS